MDDSTTYQQPALPPGSGRRQRSTASTGPGPTTGHSNNTTATPRRAPDPTTSAPPPPAAVVPPKALRARRRRPAMIVLAIALIASGGLGGAVLYKQSGERVSVLALAHDVPFGQRIKDSDLTEAQISLDPALKPLGAGSWEKATTMRATADLKSGTILTKGMVTRKPVLQPNQETVPVAAKNTQIPAGRLTPGRLVVISSTPDPNAVSDSGNDNKDDDQPEPAKTFQATVIRIGKPDVDGGVVIDVAVDPGVASDLAAVVASQKFLVILAAHNDANKRAGDGG